MFDFAKFLHGEWAKTLSMPLAWDTLPVDCWHDGLFPQRFAIPFGSEGSRQHEVLIAGTVLETTFPRCMPVLIFQLIYIS